jgi:hypothetical protein
LIRSGELRVGTSNLREEMPSRCGQDGESDDNPDDLNENDPLVPGGSFVTVNHF